MSCKKTTTPSTGRPVEDMLREIALVLAITRQVRSEMTATKPTNKRAARRVQRVAAPVALTA